MLSIVLFTGSCSSSKKTIANAGIQNLTARYNILYNANELIKESEANIEAAHIDDYEQILSVYKEPSDITSQAELKNLDSVIKKMNFLIDEKVQSNYIDDAYFLKGKANYLKTSYFNASEFFNYVYTTYTEEKELKQASLVWKARALLQLNEPAEAAIALDTALKYLETEKKSVADIYATSAQLYIQSGRIAEADKMLEQALDVEKNSSNKIRWTYLLAQLQERNKQLQEAYANYTKVIKSNAPFEMAFNANLNRIHIENQQKGNAGNQIEMLEALLKDNKSKEFIDQIHYRIAGLYQSYGQQEAAIRSYNLSIRSSTKNQNQKGLAYAQLAEIYFKNGDYRNAKIYYDSTLTVLAPTYPNYEQIRLKGSNLDLLAKSFKTIAREDTLQLLAGMSQAKRDLFIDSLLQAKTQKAGGSTIFLTNIPYNVSASKFYFNNPIALSQGVADFKQRWGNRRLEDNWRRSSKTSAEITAVPFDPNTAVTGISTNINTTDSTAFRKSYTDNLPLSSLELELSNQKIVNAYFDIANFYKDVLKDNEEAINTYAQILIRYPENTIKPAIYYNLYRLYLAPNPAKSAEYRDILVKQYPETTFARIITDPGYNQKTDDKAIALNLAYDEIYNLYIEKKYAEVITRISETEQKFGKNSFSPQLAYLNALATGRTKRADVFETALQQIVQTYPGDRLITPLARQNLEYVSANRDLMSKRAVALLDIDPNEPKFIEPKVELPVQRPTIVSTPAVRPPVNQPVQRPADLPATRPDIPNSSIFSLPDSSEYYFVVNVLNPRTNLNSSRFGIGQFNRSNYSREKISHHLEQVNKENQLILVGPFSTRYDVERYQADINPLMKDIMKVPANTYNTFIATKPGLDKLTTRDMINTYLEYYTQAAKNR